MSPPASARKVGAAALPDVGPAKTTAAFCVASVSVRLPVVVTGEFETVKIDGAVMPTLVTVPLFVRFVQVASSRRKRVLPLFAPGSGTAPEAWLAPEALNVGMSAGTIALNVGVAALPLDGPAKKLLAFWVMKF